jgi:hypothetical protein
MEALPGNHVRLRTRPWGCLTTLWNSWFLRTMYVYSMTIDVIRTLTIDHRTLQAFQLVDKEPFRRLLTYLRPSLADEDIPHCTKLRKEISERAEAVENRIKDKLQVRLILFLVHAFMTRVRRVKSLSHLIPGRPAPVTPISPSQHIMSILQAIAHRTGPS